MSIITGVNGAGKATPTAYVGVNGVAKKLSKGYVGVNGVAKQFYSGIVLPALPWIVSELQGVNLSADLIGSNMPGPLVGKPAHIAKITLMGAGAWGNSAGVAFSPAVGGGGGACNIVQIKVDPNLYSLIYLSTGYTNSNGASISSNCTVQLPNGTNSIFVANAGSNNRTGGTAAYIDSLNILLSTIAAYSGGDGGDYNFASGPRIRGGGGGGGGAGTTANGGAGITATYLSSNSSMTGGAGGASGANAIFPGAGGKGANSTTSSSANGVAGTALGCGGGGGSSSTNAASFGVGGAGGANGAGYAKYEIIQWL